MDALWGAEFLTQKTQNLKQMHQPKKIIRTCPAEPSADISDQAKDILASMYIIAAPQEMSILLM